MQNQVSTRPERAVQITQEAVKILLKEPLKEALKETLSEEGVVSGEATADSLEQGRSSSGMESDDETADSGSGFPGFKLIALGTVLLGGALVLKRRNSGASDTDTLHSVSQDESDTASEVGVPN